MLIALNVHIYIAVWKTHRNGKACDQIGATGLGFIRGEWAWHLSRANFSHMPPHTALPAITKQLSLGTKVSCLARNPTNCSGMVSCQNVMPCRMMPG